jgi:hypothetical protein
MPRQSFILRGGCNCHAVRYQISVPEWDSRARLPWHTPGKDIGDVRIPISTICHCNDCRRATTSLGAYGLITDMSTVELSVLSRKKTSTSPRNKKISSTFDSRLHGSNDTNSSGYNGSSRSRKLYGADDDHCDADDDVYDDDDDDDSASVTQIDDDKRRWIPAAALLDVADPASLPLRRLWIRRYESSPIRSRFFCGRCGTQIGVCPGKDGSIPKEWGWPRILDICTGTVDRESLENEDWFKPERAVFTEFGIPWVRRLIMGGLGCIPEHPRFQVDVVMEDSKPISKTEDDDQYSVNQNTGDGEKQKSLGLWGDSWKVQAADST